MTSYHLFYIDRDDLVTGLETVRCQDDAAARSRAVEMAKAYGHAAVEIWNQQCPIESVTRTAGKDGK